MDVVRAWYQSRVGLGVRSGRSDVATAAVAAMLGLSALGSSPARASTMPEIGPGGSVLSGTTLSLKEGDGRPELLDKITLYGDVPVAAPGQPVMVNVSRNGKPKSLLPVPVDPASGRYRMHLKLRTEGDYVVQASYGADRTNPISFSADPPQVLEPGPQTLLFNRLLKQRRYYMGQAAVTDEPGENTSLGISALRKQADMTRNSEYAPSLFSYLLNGKGGFEPVHDEEGRYVEVDISRQVMALIEDGVVKDIFGVSSGAGGTPRGEFEFYDKVPGYNAKGMYYSVFYDGNYATHGYSSVPDYPASHGCVRNPIPYSRYIYDWIALGDKMYIYD
jgi:hypothetical protein